MQKGRYIAANNVSKIPERKLRIMMDIIEARHAEKRTIVVEKNSERFRIIVKFAKQQAKLGQYGVSRKRKNRGRSDRNI